MVDESANEQLRLLQQKVEYLQKKLHNTEQALLSVEDSSKKMEQVYNATLKSLEQQKQALAQKNEELEALHKVLLTQNRELERISSTDPLTGILNRRKFIEHLHIAFQDFERYNLPCSVILMDLDHFKRVNDTYGHKVGDDVLKKTANLVSSDLRSTDILGRWGGEEFIILCRNTTDVLAYHAACHLREKIEKDPFMRAHGATSSFGISGLSEHLNSDELINNADIALYKAKQHRNCAVLYESEMPLHQ